mgnify:CR=1 FL=1
MCIRDSDSPHPGVGKCRLKCGNQDASHVIAEGVLVTLAIHRKPNHAIRRAINDQSFQGILPILSRLCRIAVPGAASPFHHAASYPAKLTNTS